jgi:hypothetical protein
LNARQTADGHKGDTFDARLVNGSLSDFDLRSCSAAQVAAVNAMMATRTRSEYPQRSPCRLISPSWYVVHSSWCIAVFTA